MEIKVQNAVITKADVLPSKTDEHEKIFYLEVQLEDKTGASFSGMYSCILDYISLLTKLFDKVSRFALVGQEVKAILSTDGKSIVGLAKTDSEDWLYMPASSRPVIDPEEKSFTEFFK